jgi:hypothetical protein
MLGAIARYRSVIILLGLGISGLILIGVSHTFHLEWFKIPLDRLIAEVGALILVVGILHWLFDLGLRKEMLREVSASVVGSTVLHECGLDSCSMNSRQVDDSAHWSQSAHLTIGNQYSARFFKDFHHVLRERCRRKLPTTVTVLHSDGSAAAYLRGSMSVDPGVKAAVSEILALLEQIDNGTKKYVHVIFHNQVLRYSFIQTGEYIWIKFFTNSPGRAIVPAFKVRSGTPLFNFFADDIKRLLECSDGKK